MRIALTFSVLIASFFATQICWPQDSIEFSFATAKVEEPDERALLRFRSGPVYEWCELVEFDVEKLLNLIGRIRSGTVSIERTSVTLQLPSSMSEIFHGTEYQIPDARKMNSPYTWGGKVTAEPELFAYFIVSASRKADATISAKDGKYKLSPSGWSDDYFLCKWNLDYSSKIKKID